LLLLSLWLSPTVCRRRCSSQRALVVVDVEVVDAEVADAEVAEAEEVDLVQVQGSKRTTRCVAVVRAREDDDILRSDADREEHNDGDDEDDKT